jgi:hypothetical protein
MAHNPIFSQLLHDMLLEGTSMPLFKMDELIAITLLKFSTRKATVGQITEIVKAFPYFQRVLTGDNDLRRAAVDKVFEDIERYLVECRVKFDVHFPPNRYRELRSQPPKSAVKLAGQEAMERWLAKEGTEIAEEENTSSTRYHFNYDEHIGRLRSGSRN